MIFIPYVFLGGGIGAVMRYLLTLATQPLGLKTWMGTLVANLVGCLFFFLFYKYFYQSVSKSLSLFVLTGLLGGLTTFSTFSFEIISSVKEGRFSEASLILFLNLFMAFLMGLVIIRGET